MNVDDSGFSDVIADRPGREVNTTGNAGSFAVASFDTSLYPTVFCLQMLLATEDKHTADWNLWEPNWAGRQQRETTKSIVSSKFVSY